MKTYKKVCIVCHKEFITDNPSKKICPDTHYRECPYCGKPIVWNKTQPFKGCRECVYKNAAAKRKVTMMEKYGAPTTLQSTDLKKKYQTTMIEKYGQDNPMKVPDIQETARKTNLDRYGATNVMQNKDIATKSAKERMKNIDQTMEKIKSTWLEKYGTDNVSKLPETIEKITQTFIERYGVKRAAQVPEFKEKMVKTNLERYGVPYFVQSEQCTSINHFRISQINYRFGSLLDKAGIEYNMEFSIGRKSYDLRILNTNILVEIDPTYTHNCIGNHWDSHGTPPDYHKDKTRVAQKNGYRCIHVFDWDDVEKIVHMVKPCTSVYARKCNIYVLSRAATDAFLNQNHIQGSCKGQVLSVGLVHEGELLQVMTFGKSRYSKRYITEMLRLCTKPGYRVIGGASKLFRWVVDTYELYDIVSYCDLAKFTGNVYTQMGMKLDHISPPQEIWSKGKHKITANLLRQRGFDQLFHTNYGKGTNNEQLMLDHGWLPVYDCGQAVYVYGRDKL